jgi:hypothetical protein
MYMGGKRMGKADTVKMIGTVKCEMKDWSLSGPEMSKIDADTYAISYKATFDGSCADEHGKMQKVPSPVRGASVWVRNGDKWQAVFHGENMIVEPKGAPAADEKSDAKDAKKEEPKKPEADKDDKKTDEKAAPKADDSKKADDKAAPKADDKSMAKKDDKTAANTTGKTTDTSTGTGTADPNTDALVAIQKSGWEAWRNKDTAKFEQLTTADLAFVGPDGIWHSGKSEVIKTWTTMNCEGVTKTDFKNGFASAISPTVEVLTGVGTSDGKCNGQKNGDLDNVAFYVKEGNDWKLAFLFESMPMS